MTDEFLDLCTLHVINKDDDCVFSGMTARYFDRTLNKAVTQKLVFHRRETFP